MKPPSPHTAITRRSGLSSAAMIADGRPAPIVASALSSSSVLATWRSVVAREPDLVHAVVEADDAVLRHHRAHVVHEALRDQRKAVVLGALVDVPEDVLAQVSQRRIAVGSLPSSRSASACTLAPMSPTSSASG